jgi:hypothetical protein
MLDNTFNNYNKFGMKIHNKFSIFYVIVKWLIYNVGFQIFIITSS